LPDCGEKLQFSDRGGDFIFVRFEAEGSGHAATSGSGRLELDAQTAQKRFLRGHLHNGFVVAVSVKQGLARELGELGIGAEPLLKELA
jgi:hypothetical protein